MRAILLITALLFCGSAAPVPPDQPAPVDPAALREVRTCVAALWDAEVPMCIERDAVRMHQSSVLPYAKAQLYEAGHQEAGSGADMPIAYLVAACRPIPSKGFAFPATVEEREEYCTLYMLPS